MPLDLRTFLQATNPGRTLFLRDNPEEDNNYYIDFSSVRGGQIIENLRDNITLLSPDVATCELFTGHIGCGKSTELLRLKAKLEREGFHVVYFDSGEYLEYHDVDIADILLAIAHGVIESLERLELEEATGLERLFQGAVKVLQKEFELEEVELKPQIPNVPDVGVKVNKKGFSLSFGMGKITAKARESYELRNKLREYIGPRISNTIEAINQEIIEPAIEKLKQQGKKGLVVIIDNLDRIEDNKKPWGKPQPEYLFVDRGQQLRQLKCHLVYTIPLSLRFSNEYGYLTQRFLTDPNVLPMVSIKLRDGSNYREGIELLQQMVLARAFPELESNKRLEKITELFDNPKTLELLCLISGGHIRNLLRFLYQCISQEKKFPLSGETLKQVIQKKRDQMVLAIEPYEWELLRQVVQSKKVTGDDGYKVLIRSMFVYEYRDAEGSWFDVNPILEGAEELKL